jgi:alginate O-acetyltransferase complex protein AlgI
MAGAMVAVASRGDAGWRLLAGTIGVFVISGVLHELAISFPAGGGWGLPLTYFTLHALLVRVERTMRIDRWPAAVARIWTLGWVLVLLPILFHAAFRARVVVPFAQMLQEVAR